MKPKRTTAALLVLMMLALWGTSLMGCATKGQLRDLEQRVDQAMNEAQEARSAATALSTKVDQAEAAAEAAAVRAENAAVRAEAMANKAEAAFMQKMKK